MFNKSTFLASQNEPSFYLNPNLQMFNLLLIENVE